MQINHPPAAKRLKLHKQTDTEGLNTALLTAALGSRQRL